MQITCHNKIIKTFLHSFYEKETFELLKKLGEKNYAKPFHVLKKSYLVRTFVIHKYKLISDYIHQLEQEQFDGN